MSVPASATPAAVAALRHAAASASGAATSAAPAVRSPAAGRGVRFTAPIRLVSEANVREHWATKARRAKQQRVDLAWLLARETRPALPVVVTLTRLAPRALDDDNLRGACKAVRDQIAVWLGLPVNAKGIADDRDPRVVWAYGQERGEPRQYALRVEIVAADGEAA